VEEEEEEDKSKTIIIGSHRLSGLSFNFIDCRRERHKKRGRGLNCVYFF
jgi:hypothetical protein